MAIINKEKYLRDIASAVRKGAVHFDKEDRPVVDMGGVKVYVGGVSYDMDLGVMTYDIQNGRGTVIPSANGARPLSQLDQKTLRSVDAVVREYVSYRMARTRNLVNIESARAALSSRKPLQVG